MLHRWQVVVLICSCTFFSACSKAPPPVAAPAGSTNTNGATVPGPPGSLLAKPADDAPTLVGEVVTSGEYVDVAKDIEAAAEDGDAAKLSGFFDMNALVETALKD